MCKALKPSKFLPAKRTEANLLKAQFDELISLPSLRYLCDSMSEGVLIINQERQIVFANRYIKQFTGKTKTEDYLGQRPGELFNCINACNDTGGCGTSLFCTECGAPAAILASCKNNRREIRECNILTRDKSALNFEISTTPLKVGKHDYILCTLQNVSDEKRRGVLERIFFHDIMNTASGIQGLSKLLQNKVPAEQDLYVKKICESMTSLIGEVESQRELLSMERGDLSIQLEPLDALLAIRDVRSIYKNHAVAQNRTLQVIPAPEKNIFEQRSAPAHPGFGQYGQECLRGMPRRSLSNAFMPRSA